MTMVLSGLDAMVLEVRGEAAGRDPGRQAALDLAAELQRLAVTGAAEALAPVGGVPDVH